ncbi:sensor domain-containing diguanylate cyclase [Fontimonas sp. SYSU GA230001]|uniref:GGDEF domain-containing protein n=1 Tax=Fontimonas sp. SYSU GA230001 TaxID=3142450 RepID=UPI0032B3D9B8
MQDILLRLARSVSDAQELEGLTRPLLELLEAVTGLESTYLTTIDEAAGVQHVLFSRNTSRMQIPEGLSVPWGDTLCKRALDENLPYCADVAAHWGDSDAARALGIQTYLSQPVRTADGQLYGTLCAASPRKVEIRSDTLKILGLFAQLIAHQVDRERAVREMRKAHAELTAHALTDALTGVANRRALEIELRRRLGAAQPAGRTLQVAFIDLDGFKAINDRHGHDVGDRFLIHIAKRLQATMQPGDFVARNGGDEFVVVTTGCDDDALRRQLEAATTGRFEYGEVVIDYPGASVGVVHAEPGESDVATLLRRADAAMYAVKKSRSPSRRRTDREDAAARRRNGP